MKHKIISNEPVFLTNSSGVTVDNSLNASYEKALNSPFIKRKMEQAEAFIAKHGLPDTGKANEKEKTK